MRGQKLRLFCDSLVEEFDETLTGAVRAMHPDLIEHMCIRETALCTAEDLEFNKRDGKSDFGLEMSGSLSLDAPSEKELEVWEADKKAEEAAKRGDTAAPKKKKKKKKRKRKRRKNNKRKRKEKKKKAAMAEK